jgi:hypothetical protein
MLIAQSQFYESPGEEAGAGVSNVLPFRRSHGAA